MKHDIVINGGVGIYLKQKIQGTIPCYKMEGFDWNVLAHLVYMEP
jgi:hypothetical protein